MLDTEIAIDLVESRLSIIRSEISEILETWEVADPELFIAKAKSGESEEAEMDAIAMRQLLINLEKFEQILVDILKDT